MLMTQKAIYAVIVLEIEISQPGISFYDLVEDVEVQGKPIDTFNLLNQFSTDGASHSKVVMESSQAFRAKGVTTMDQDPWNSLTYVELVSTEVAIVKTPIKVITLYHFV